MSEKPTESEWLLTFKEWFPQMKAFAESRSDRGEQYMRDMLDLHAKAAQKKLVEWIDSHSVNCTFTRQKLPARAIPERYWAALKESVQK